MHDGTAAVNDFANPIFIQYGLPILHEAGAGRRYVDVIIERQKAVSAPSCAESHRPTGHTDTNSKPQNGGNSVWGLFN